MSEGGRRAALVLASLLWPALLPGQEDPVSLARRPLVTRAALDSLARIVGADPGEAQAVALVRFRLEAGDFQPGDRVWLRVEGQTVLSDTFDVGGDSQLNLPLAGAIALRGVLFSELEGYLTEQLALHLRYPLVHARPLIRLSVQGAVARPGFYFIPPDAGLADALNAAGGTTRDAKLDKAYVERDGREVLKGRQLRQTLAQGRTLDDARLVPGDELVVPGRPGDGMQDRLRFLWLIVSLTGGLYGLTRII